MIRCAALLVIRGIQIKTIIKYQFTATRMAATKMKTWRMKKVCDEEEEE